MEKVLVTGASSYIGLHCISELLAQGFFVLASLRDQSKISSVVSALKPLIKNNNLEFVNLDLLEDFGWDSATRECRYVLHVASPFPLKDPKHEDELIIPARDGTIRALRSSSLSNVKRVVVTSSIAAICYGHDNGDIVLDHDSWTNTNARNITSYVKSKTIAEKSAWSFIQKNKKHLEISVINPGFVLGPLLNNNLEGASASIMRKIIMKEIPLIPNIFMNCVDVRDVAKLHVLAMLSPKANNMRFPCITDHPISFEEIAKILITNGISAPSLSAPDWLIRFLGMFNKDMKIASNNLNRKFLIDNSQTKRVFNWEPIPIEKTIVDMAKDIQGKINLAM
tara:strand:+ start:1450 stop:2463 length:1014 start_codon:yes stop_codon:yes gene_type:complete